MASLNDHHIARIDPIDLVSHYPRPVGRNARLGHHGSGPVAAAAIVTTDRGATGWALTHGRMTDTERGSLVGLPLTDLFDADRGVIDDRARALDLALHDLAGVILGEPVWRLLGARGETTMPCYSGAIYFDDLDPVDAPAGIDAVLTNVRADHDAGYRAFKLKMGRGNKWLTPHSDGLAADIAVTRAVRETFPDVTILVDINDGSTPDAMREYLTAVSDCRLFWVEEPFPETRDDLALLRQTLNEVSPDTLIAEGESGPDVPAVLELARTGLVDVMLMDIVSYGLTAWRGVMADVVAAEAVASPHAWGVPVKTLYTAQMAAGLGDVVTVEGVPGHADGIDTSGYRLSDGMISVPDAPGFGIAAPMR
ncbi:MAG TPA: enolase C-terminal domain-like protein [Thermomicrobiales bacterium]|nr:enolase C-terminal domain-like protein [Thermomicrobiales bacterium]